MNNCQLTLLKFEVDKLHFDLNENYRQDSEQVISLEPKLTVSIMDGESEEKVKKVTISCYIFEDAEKRNLPFTCSAQVSGIFKAEENSSEESIEHIFKYNATAILLPYLRAAISQLTCLAEKRPVRIPIINVYDLIDRGQQPA